MRLPGFLPGFAGALAALLAARFWLVLVALAAAVFGGWLYSRYASAWTPSDGQIAELEELFRLPAVELRRRFGNFDLGVPLGNLRDYARHYAGVTEGGRRIVVGVFVEAGWFHHEPAGIYIGSEAELPVIFDGGCGVITLRYDLSNKEIRAWCNGVT
jgi:hypothetical protein